MSKEMVGFVLESGREIPRWTRRDATQHLEYFANQKNQNKTDSQRSSGVIQHNSVHPKQARSCYQDTDCMPIWFSIITETV